MVLKTPECNCPTCGAKFSALGHPDENKDSELPEPGDASICIGCGELLEVTEDLTVKKMALETEFQVARETPELYREVVRAQAAVREHNRRIE